MTLEDLIMVHRFLYYVENSPVISDYEYDILQRQADIFCDKDSPIHKVGSDLPSSYTDNQKQLAYNLLEQND